MAGKIKKFSLYLPPDLWRAIRDRALAEDRNITTEIARAIRFYLENTQPAKKGKP